MNLLIAYCETALFKKYIPLLISLLPKGIKVERMPFPAFTPVETREAELERMFKRMPENSLYLSDVPCTAMYEGLGHTKGVHLALPKNMRPTKTLNYAFKVAAMKHDKTQSFETTFKKVATAFVEKPDHIWIATRRLVDDLNGYANSPALKKKFTGQEKLFREYLKAILEKHYGAVPIETTPDIHFYSSTLENRDCLVISANSVTTCHFWKREAQLMLLPLGNSTERLIEIGKLHVELDSKNILAEIPELANLK